MIADGTICEGCEGPILPGDERQWFHGFAGLWPKPVFEPMHLGCRSVTLVSMLEELEPLGVTQVVEHLTENVIGPLVRGWSDEPADLSAWLAHAR